MVIKIIHGYMEVVDRILKIFGSLGGWKILKNWDFSRRLEFLSILGVFGIINSAEGVHIKNPKGWKNPFSKL